MHSNFASRFDLLFSFESEKASVNPAALCRNRYKISLFYFFAGHLVPFSSLLISGHVSWAWFFSFFLFACPRVNGEAFDINTKLEACMFLCSFLTASSVSEGPSVSSSVQYVTVPTSVGAVWSSHCASRSLFFFCSGFFLFWKKKKHTVETFPLHGSWIAFADFYDDLFWSLLILLSVVLTNICCTALTATWRAVLLSLYDT